MEDSLQIDRDRRVAVFRFSKRVAGVLVLDDPFKPYLHPVRTPAGHEVSVAMPGDHRHHKGLMYALTCADLNFWEEEPGSGRCGVQEITGMEETGEGLALDLLWREEGGGLPTYRERRTITCRFDGGAHAFVWSWRTRREALRDHRLVKSPWSLEVQDGRKINYHGLGIRLPWMWAFQFSKFNGVELAGKESEPMEACGSNGPEATWWGRIDGHWAPPVAAVTFRQPVTQAFCWFAIKGDFAYLSVGPSNAEELDVAAGTAAEESYEVIVADR